MKTIIFLFILTIPFLLFGQDGYIMFSDEVGKVAIRQPDQQVLDTYHRWTGQVIWPHQTLDVDVYSIYVYPTELSVEIIFPITDTLSLGCNGWYKALMRNGKGKYQQIILHINPGKRSLTMIYDENVHFEMILARVM